MPQRLSPLRSVSSYRNGRLRKQLLKECDSSCIRCHMITIRNKKIRYETHCVNKRLHGAQWGAKLNKQTATDRVEEKGMFSFSAINELTAHIVMCNVKLKFLSCVCVVLAEICQEPFTIHCLLYSSEAVKGEW